MCKNVKTGELMAAHRKLERNGDFSHESHESARIEKNRQCESEFVSIRVIRVIRGR